MKFLLYSFHHKILIRGGAHLVVEPEVKPEPSGMSKKKHASCRYLFVFIGRGERWIDYDEKKTPRSTKSNQDKKVSGDSWKCRARNWDEAPQRLRIERMQSLQKISADPSLFRSLYLGSRYCPSVNTDISWKDWKKLKKEAASNKNWCSFSILFVFLFSSLDSTEKK